VGQRRHDIMLVAALLAVGLGVRLLVVWATRHSFGLRADGADYFRIASSLAHGHGFGHSVIAPARGASAFRPPLYPFLLGGLFKVTGPSVAAARVLNAFVGTAALAVIGLLAFRVGGRRVGIVALAIGAVYPPLLLAGYAVQYEALYTLLTCGALVAGLRHAKQPGAWRWVVLSGVLVGFGVLCRESAAILLVPLGVLVWTSAPSARVRLVRLGVLVACCVAIVAPWTIRNAVRLHAFVPVSTSLGFAAGGTYNATSAAVPGNGGVWIYPLDDPANRRLVSAPTLNEVQVDAALRRASLRYVSDHPAYLGTVVASNTVRLFDLRGTKDARAIAPFVPYDDTLLLGAVVGFYVFAALAVGGAFTKRARQVPVAVWLVPILLTAGIVLVGANIRYRAPIEPYVVLLGALALVSAAEVASQRWASRDGDDRVTEREGHAGQEVALAGHRTSEAAIEPRRNGV
jgi:4-amino-4-deoxy-L-arabinose transferase-like glycosyltransferase